jgi:DNA-binding Lrp family transcriptional regulator
MPNRVKDRAIIAQTMIDLVQTVRSGRMSKVRSIETVIISAAVMIGQAKGHPRTEAEVARAVNLPRVTVLRKLESLVRDGFIERHGHRYTAVDPVGGYDYVDDALNIIRRANNITTS